MWSACLQTAFSITVTKQQFKVYAFINAGIHICSTAVLLRSSNISFMDFRETLRSCTGRHTCLRDSCFLGAHRILT